ALDYLINHYKERLIERYHLSNIDQDKVAVLDEIGQKRGFLQSGGYVDYDKVYEILLREIRSVKLGRLSFERPSDIPVTDEQ
nr:ribosome biogenesis GTPase YlqF [Turicibacter sp.]